MATFDLDGARASGKTDAEIIDYLSGRLSFDAEGARAAGFTDADILSKLMQRVDTPASPPSSSPAPAVPDASIFEKLGDLGKQAATWIKERRLEPLAAVLKTGTHYDEKAFESFVVGRGLEENLAAFPNDPEAALKATIRQNLSDTILTTFDLAAAGTGAAVTAPIRALAAKAGLAPALATIAAGAVEGGSYTATYNALEAALEGHSIGDISRKAVEGGLFGAAVGGVVGGAAVGIGRLADSLRRIRVAKEVGAAVNAATAQEAAAFEATKAAVREANPHLGDEAVDKAAAALHFDGKPTNTLPIPDPLPAPKPGEGQAVRGTAALAPDAETAAAFDQALSSAAVNPIPPAVLRQRATTVPFEGPKDLQELIRATGGEEPWSVREAARNVRRFLVGAFEAEPGVTDQVKDLLFRARTRIANSQDTADILLDRRVFALFTGSRVEKGKKAAALSDYMHALDRVATLRSKGAAQEVIEGIGIPRATGPGGTILQQWEQAVEPLRQAVEREPEIVQAQQALRNLLDEMFDTMQEYGLIEKGQYGTGMLPRYRRDYLPAHHIYDVAAGLARHFSGTAIGKELNAVLERTTAGEVVETNIVRVMRVALSALNRKVAEIELWRAIEAHPNLNLTSHFQVGDIIPKGYRLYRPGPGMPGYLALDAQQEAVQAALAGLPIPKDRFMQGAYVLEEDLANRLNHFYERTTSETERALYRLARNFARHLTLYSPSNTPLNAMSDSPLAALGLPGERSDLFGFLRFLPSSFKESFRGAFGKGSSVYNYAVQQGIGGSTFIHSLGGEVVPGSLEAALAQGRELSRLEKVKDFIHHWVRVRQAIEAAPRIAAGRAAVARTGNPAEFARVGQQATLPFGAGDPAITRAPLMTLLAPFWRWTGMAANRTVRLATTKGSRARGVAALTVPASAAALWNLQNDEYRRVELSLGDYDHNHLHVIVPDPADPSKPLRKANGQPMVWRMRFWVPEEIMGLMGLGNLPGRLYDIAQGRTASGEFVKEGVSEVGAELASLPAAISTTTQLLTGRSSLTGEQMETFERAETTLPLFYHVGKFLETAHNEGLGAAAVQAPARIVGIRPAGVRLGRADARIQKLKREITDAQLRMRTASMKGDQFRVGYYRKKLEGLGREIQAAAAARQEMLRSEAP